MTNPNHTDTSRSGDLVERLRSMTPASPFAPTENFPPHKAADRIEALEAEVEGLREVLEHITDIEPDADNMGRFHDIARAALDTLAWQRREIDRLTKGLRDIERLWRSNELTLPDDPFEDGYDAGLRTAGRMAQDILEAKP